MSSSLKGLDLRTVIEVPLRQFVPWLAMVLLVAWAGYPGVVCHTHGMAARIVRWEYLCGAFKK